MEDACKMQLGEWKLAREIGRGAYGIVYLATGPDGNRVAIKMCRRDALDDVRYERELRGAKLYQSIPPQDGLVRMTGLVETEWGFYTVMELADNEFGEMAEMTDEYRPKTLASVIEGEKALPLTECVKLAGYLAKGLVALQRHHLLHRDIKPANVLYVGGHPVLSDPGLVVEEANAVSLVGTPGYVPPEQFTDAASDIYSLGLTLRAASFGRQLEDLDKGPAMEADTGAKLFPAWWRILNKATDPTPARRYQSAKALLRDLNTLRMKMSFSLPAWTKALKTTSLVMALLVFAYGSKEAILAYLEYHEIRTSTQAKDDWERLESELKPMKRMVEIANSLNDGSSKDSLVWSSFAGSYFCHTDEAHRQRLNRVKETDPDIAAEMQTVLDKMLEIDRKGQENNRQIKILRDEAESGQNAAEKFNQAELLSMENEKLVKAWLALLEQFTILEDGSKVKD